MDQHKPRFLGDGKQYYIQQYDASLLDKISRNPWNRLDISAPFGFDRWFCFEVSAQLKTGDVFLEGMYFDIPVSSRFIVESKSLKLYLNSLNFEVFDSKQACLERISSDLSRCLEEDIYCKFFEHHDFSDIDLKKFHLIRPRLTQNNQSQSLIFNDDVNERQAFVFQSFRSCCPVTQQPDWGSVFISFEGPRLCPSSLFSYLITYRQHLGFHEVCMDQIFNDLNSKFKLSKFSLRAFFKRRGGISICPHRFSFNCNDLKIHWSI